MRKAVAQVPLSVKRTSGGRFKRSDRGIYFIATGPEAFTKLDTSVAPYVLVAVNELNTNARRDALQEIIESGKCVLLDSGIFNLANSHAQRHGISHNEALNLAPTDVDGFQSLFDLYCSLVERYADRLWGAIELDLGGRENKVKTRALLESQVTGFVPIPVYHPLGDGWDYFDELANGYDRICCGNIVQAAPQDRLMLAHTFHERAKAYPYLWTHLLGYTPTGTTNSVPVQGSCDSSSWLAALRWGVDSARATALLAPMRDLPFDQRFNRVLVGNGSDNDRTNDDMKRWSATRFRCVNLNLKHIQQRKHELGITTQPRYEYDNEHIEHHLRNHTP